MRAVIQRVHQATVVIDQQHQRQIAAGLLVFLAVEPKDAPEDRAWLIKKILGLRIFNDETEKMNRSVLDIGGELMIISQFTLFASTKKGSRPSFSSAAPPNLARQQYLDFVNDLRAASVLTVQTGEFAAHMDVSLINNGPVTLIIDSHLKW